MRELRPNESLRYLRASVASVCNLNCIYCPKQSGMENFTPSELGLPKLDVSQYIRNLERIANTGIVNAVSFTGGEPTLNPALGDIVEAAARSYARVELTTNGRELDRHLAQMAPHLDLVKVSLDGSTATLANPVSRGRGDNHQRAVDAIQACLRAGLNVGINVVAMRRTLKDLRGIIELVQTLGEAHPKQIYVSILDLYYTDETRELWTDEFVPLESLADSLTSTIGEGEVQNRHGCGIEWWDSEGIQIRLKDSFAGTFRAPKCSGCKIYCQEGYYGLKHSTEGWVTGCPSSAEELGTWLDPSLSDAEAQRRLAPLLGDLTNSEHVQNSFDIFLARNGLQTPVMNDGP